jgi:hypothetical protein
MNWWLPVNPKLWQLSRCPVWMLSSSDQLSEVDRSFRFWGKYLRAKRSDVEPVVSSNHWPAWVLRQRWSENSRKVRIGWGNGPFAWFPLSLLLGHGNTWVISICLRRSVITRGIGTIAIFVWRSENHSIPFEWLLICCVPPEFSSFDRVTRWNPSGPLNSLLHFRAITPFKVETHWTGIEEFPEGQIQIFIVPIPRVITDLRRQIDITHGLPLQSKRESANQANVRLPRPILPVLELTDHLWLKIWLGSLKAGGSALKWRYVTE